MSDASAIPKSWTWAKSLGDYNNYKLLIIGFAFLGLFAGVAAYIQVCLNKTLCYSKELCL
jgi:hypothetical protein